MVNAEHLTRVSNAETHYPSDLVFHALLVERASLLVANAARARKHMGARETSALNEKLMTDLDNYTRLYVQQELSGELRNSTAAVSVCGVQTEASLHGVLQLFTKTLPTLVERFVIDTGAQGIHRSVVYQFLKPACVERLQSARVNRVERSTIGRRERETAESAIRMHVAMFGEQ